MSGAKKLVRGLKHGSGHIDRALKQIGIYYLGFTKRRFYQYSRGGGDWEPLAESTLRQRRGSGKGAAILRDTGLLFNAIGNSGRPKAGAQLQKKGKKIRVGWDERTQHRYAQMTFAELADIHQRGRGNVPARKLLVEPDSQTKQRMRRALSRAVEKQGQM